MAACGVFHYRHYVRHLSEQRVLQRFYYSHRRSTDGPSLGLTDAQAVNLPAKEYLTHAHLRLISHRLGNLAFPIYQRLWESQVLRSWQDADLLHLLIHGSGRRLIERARQGGARVLGEPVNAHPRFVQNLMREEYERLHLDSRQVAGLNHGQCAILEESAAADILIAPSRFVANSYIAEGTAPARIVVEPYGTDLTRFHPGPREDDGVFRVLCVAQISPRKGHIDLLDAWQQLNLPRSELAFVGSMTPEMDLVLKDRRHLFTYLGRVPHAELSREFHRSDVVVLPSIEDGFSVVPLEAMACGLPVIVSANAGVSELVDGGQTGFVVPIRSPGSIAERILELWQDMERRKQMGRAAAVRVRTDLGWGDYAQRLTARYVAITARSPETHLAGR